MLDSRQTKDFLFSRINKHITPKKGNLLNGLSDILKKKKILCVEDHQDTCELLAFLLSEYTLVFSDSVAKSIELFKAQSFDLCLLDNWLIDGFGVDLCQQILTLNPGIPIIFASGVAQRHEIQKAFDAGAKAYLVKPYNPDELQQIVKELIEK